MLLKHSVPISTPTDQT